MSLIDSLSLLTVTDKQAMAAAKNLVQAAAVHVILHGNSRNFKDAIDALAVSGGVTKSGRAAFNRKGAVYRALQSAMVAALAERDEFLVLYNEHVGQPTEMMVENAKYRAGKIASQFQTSLALG